MAELADRVWCKSSTTGTGTLTLGSAEPGYRTFDEAVTDGHLTDGATVDFLTRLATEWEVARGVYDQTANTLTRATILASSNGGAAVNWGAGDKDVMLTASANYLQRYGPLTTTLASYSNSAAETTICTVVIPANTVADGETIFVRAHVNVENNDGAISSSCSFNGKIGSASSNMFAFGFGTGPTNHGASVRIELVRNGNTLLMTAYYAEAIDGVASGTDVSGGTYLFTGLDFTSAINFLVTGDLSALGADPDITVECQSASAWIAPTAGGGGGGGGGASPLTTKGDIYTHDGSADARQAVGADGTMLAADSTATNGLAFKNPFRGSFMQTQDTTFGTAQHNFALNADTVRLRVTATANSDMTGFTGGVDGRILIIHNIASSGNVRFLGQNVNSTDVNRIAYSGSFSIGFQFSAWFIYDGVTQRWRPMGMTA